MDALTAEKGKIHELTDMDVQFVSLVNRGANRQSTFLMVKTGNKINTEKLVPGSDMPLDDQRIARDSRSERYGIEVLESGSSLTYPAGFPTSEGLYGDPVNLKYPCGDAENKVDMGRLRNALARFKQAHTAYTAEQSKKNVYERIVRRALAEGIDVSYNPEDPVDSLLPKDLKDALKTEDAAKGLDAETAVPPKTVDDATEAWLDAASEQIADLILDAALSGHHKEQGNVEKVVCEQHTVAAQPAAEPVVQKAQGKLLDDLEQLRLENEAQKRVLAETKEALRKAELYATRVKQGAVGASSGLITGNAQRRQQQAVDPVAKRWVSGGDMAPRDE
jgi:hypothetical protein